MISIWLERVRAKRRRRVKALAKARLGFSLAVTGVYLALIFALHTVAMMSFEKLSFGDSLWLTLTTATTVGYGDLSASTVAGRWATAVLLYAGGIFVLAKLAGDYFDYRSERNARMARGEWEWDMRDHIVIVNKPTEDPIHYFEVLIREFRKSHEFANVPVQILTEDFPTGLPAVLAELGDVVHYRGSGVDSDALAAVDVDKARAVAVLSVTDYDPACDSLTFDILHRLRSLGVTGHVLAECVRDSNRQRFKQAGADIVIRPIRAYPGMLVRGFVAPGAQTLMEELFRSDGGEYRRVSVEGKPHRWADVVSALVRNDLGVAVAYESINGELRISPHADEEVAANALFVIADEQKGITPEAVAAALGSASAT